MRNRTSNIVVRRVFFAIMLLCLVFSTLQLETAAVAQAQGPGGRAAGEDIAAALSNARLPFSGTKRFTGGPHDGNADICDVVAETNGSGLDFARSTGSDGEKFAVVSILPGTFLGSDDTSTAYGPGKRVRILHSGGIASEYWHLDSFAPSIASKTLKAGDPLPQGFLVGYAGQSGLQKSIHLHLQLKTYPGGANITWDGQSIDGYTIGFDQVSGDPSNARNYQGSAVKGSTKRLDLTGGCSGASGYALVGTNYNETGERNGVDANTVFASINIDSTAGRLNSTNRMALIPVPQKPVGAIYDRTPTYTWVTVAGATQYQYQLSQGSSVVYTNAMQASNCGANTCSQTPGQVLAYGGYTWKVRAYVGTAWQAWSASRNVTVTSKQVLVDAAHSNYYTLSSGYVTWKNLLNANGFVVTQSTSPVTASLLAGKRVYVALLPQSSYTEAEKTALYNWVNAGGSLLVIGDYYLAGLDTVTSWAVPSNGLSSKFGISYRRVHAGIDNSNYDIANYWILLYARNYTAYSSIMSGLATTETYATGPLTSTVASPVIKLDSDAVPSQAIIVEARKLGSGRVIVMGDSNFWSDPKDASKGITAYSNKAFALRVANWLATGVALPTSAFVDVQGAQTVWMTPTEGQFDPAMPPR